MILSNGSLVPITPVEAVRISDASQPSREEAHSATLQASSTPTAPTPALATLLLTMMPRAVPLFSIMSMDLTREWPLTRLEVYTPATLQSLSEYTIPTSRNDDLGSFSLMFAGSAHFMPAETPFALKPLGIVI